MAIFKDLGGIDWLRKELDKNARLPAKYYKVKQTPEFQPCQ